MRQLNKNTRAVLDYLKITKTPGSLVLHKVQNMNKLTLACVVSLIDRLIHHAEIISFEGESYHLKEAKERAEKK